MTWHFPSFDAWQRPRFQRCPVCAATLLNDADASLHAAWHDRIEVDQAKKLGNWDIVE